MVNLNLSEHEGMYMRVKLAGFGQKRLLEAEMR